jgi:hypothetical protein
MKCDKLNERIEPMIPERFSDKWFEMMQNWEGAH